MWQNSRMENVTYLRAVMAEQPVLQRLSKQGICRQICSVSQDCAPCMNLPPVAKDIAVTA